MKVTNKIKTPITISGVTIPGNATTDVPDRLKHDQRFRQLVSRGTLVEGEQEAPVDVPDPLESDEEATGEEEEPRSWFRG